MWFFGMDVGTGWTRAVALDAEGGHCQVIEIKRGFCHCLRPDASLASALPVRRK